MGTRTAILATLLGASIGVPLFLSKSTADKQATEESPAGTPAASTVARRPWETRPPRSGGLVSNGQAPIEGTPFYSLADVLRMDVSKEWVYARWARKSTGLGDPQLFGIRVPLVTGTHPSDLAGSLTYYFNSQGQVQHISLRGRTGNTSEIIRLVTQRFGFRRQQNAGPGEQVYQVKWNGHVQSELRTVPASVLRSTSPQQSFHVVVELERPGSNRFIERRPPTLALPVPAQSGQAGQVAVIKPDPPEPVPVGPVSLFQRVNNRITGQEDEPDKAASQPTGKSTAAPTKTNAKPQSASEPVPTSAPRPYVHWPG